ncbi:hypothetical protein AN218_06210 [Streptomyces nanshensis]|uniref:Uncharacterized protein n=1 Tax=Streptomyces nanshensis TaxID=518642 RepID=A0A1E7L9I8_9ACTN|nr:hypothetical protein AN218_06210 [Streptomyces nanshensis]
MGDTRAYLRHVPGVFEAVREEFEPELPLLHDGHHRMMLIQAALRLIRQHTTTPLAIGEVFNSVHDYTTLLSERLIDYVRSAVTHTGGDYFRRDCSLTDLRSSTDTALFLEPVGYRNRRSSRSRGRP